MAKQTSETTSSLGPAPGAVPDRTEAIRAATAKAAAEVRPIICASRGGWEGAEDEAVLRFWRQLTEAEREEMRKRAK